MNILTKFAFAPNRCTVEEAAKQDSAQNIAILLVLFILSLTAYLAYKTYSKSANRSFTAITVSAGLVIAIVVYYAIGIFFAPWCI